MCKENVKGNETEIINNELTLNNLLRSLTMLENAIERIGRQNYYNRSQYPEPFLDIEEAMKNIRSWIETYRIFSSIPLFIILLGLCIKELGELIKQLMLICKPLPGKKEQKRSYRIDAQRKICHSIENMLERLSTYLNQLKSVNTLMSSKIEEALKKAFENHFVKSHQKKKRYRVSMRGAKTNTVRHIYCFLQTNFTISGVNGSNSKFLTVVSQWIPIFQYFCNRFPNNDTSPHTLLLNDRCSCKTESEFFALSSL